MGKEGSPKISQSHYFFSWQKVKTIKKRKEMSIIKVRIMIVRASIIVTTYSVMVLIEGSILSASHIFTHLVLIMTL